MTKTFRLIAFALSVCAIGLTSCNQNEVVSTQVVENLSPVKTILSATVPGGSKTRINIDDQGNNGLIVTWEEGDILIAYKDGVKAAIFHYTGENGAGTGTFEAETNNALRGDYTLIYTTLPAEDHEENIDDMRQKIKTTPVTQNGSGSTAHLKYNALMEANYTSGNTATFEHMLTLITVDASMVTANSGYGQPSQFNLTVGSDKYTMELTNVNWSRSFKLYIFVNPSSGERDLTFNIRTNMKFQSTCKRATDKDYLKGYRYTATLDENSFLSINYID